MPPFLSGDDTRTRWGLLSLGFRYHPLTLKCWLFYMPRLSARLMSTALDDVIVERIDFLQELLMGEDDPAYIRTFQTQIRVLQTAQLDRLEELIAIRKKDLEASKSVFESDRLFAELDALEWLQERASKPR